MNLLVINDFGIKGGGAENRIRLLLKKFLEKKKFEEIHLVESNESNSEDILRGVKIHKCRKGARVAYSLVKQIIKRNKISILQVHNLLLVNPACILAAKMLGTKIVFFSHDYWCVCGRRSFINAEKALESSLCINAKLAKCIQCVGFPTVLKLKTLKFFVNLCDFGIAPASFVAKKFEEHGLLNAKWKIVPPWIDLESFKPMKTKKKDNILFVGSLLDYKGAIVAVEAMKWVLKACPKAKLLLVGANQEPESAFRKKIEEIAFRDNTAKSIIFAGQKNRAKLRKEYCKAKVLVVPTVCMEQTANTWMEAAACGTPSVVSSIASLPELVDGNALLFQPRNSKELAEKTILLLEDKKKNVELAKKAKTFVKKEFNVENAAKKIKKIYENILE